ncbi:aminotransferase class IV [Nocardiopsis suaedae]|uniref:Aminotransferase class IV n=1 Tax=Nocardiopsis suaedae TaxID=3018444 RepID=A0ABT4TGU4_9ACTN|nr:aminotransferase class IV [Nocardiopsis suaedae]MDA2803322.1 aminotransferase class IV [Nocardiopsis suaedae]
MMLLDGRPVTAEELAPLALYGYGHFTTMRVEDAHVRGLSLHLDRLEADCATLLGASLDRDGVRGRVREAAGRADGPVIVRVTVFDPGLELGLPARPARPRLLVSTRAAPGVPAPPLSLDTRDHERELPAVKTSSLAGALHARRAAQLGGHDDVLFVDRAGRVTEGATWNIGFIRGDEVLWPEGDVLPGTTMRLLIEAGGAAHRTVPVPVEAVPEMDGAFITNAAVGVRPVSAVGPHRFTERLPLVDRLRQAYDAVPGEAV